MNSDIVKAAALMADDAYEKPSYADASCHLKGFRPFGDLYAFVCLDPSKATAYVSFQGSDTFRNWFFSNLQAYFSDLTLLDAELKTCRTFPIQGGELQKPFGGATHQGFGRAFSWLWYGTDVLQEIEPEDRQSVRRRLFWHGLLIAIVPALWFVGRAFGAHVGSFYWPLLAAFVLYFVVVNWEGGTLEALDRRRYSDSAFCPLVKHLAQVNEHKTVVFTGHSLGGALATMAFAVYRAWCRKDASRSDNGLLVTFGCPRIGDADFVAKFQDLHKDRFLHVVHAGDPVPELPPAAMDNIHDRAPLWQRGLFGIMASFLILPMWRLYRWAYGLEQAGRWSSTHVYFTEGSSVRLWPWDHCSARYRDFATSLPVNVELPPKPDA